MIYQEETDEIKPFPVYFRQESSFRTDFRDCENTDFGGVVRVKCKERIKLIIIMQLNKVQVVRFFVACVQGNSA